MNEWKKLWVITPDGHAELVVCDYGYEKWITKVQAVGDKLLKEYTILKNESRHLAELGQDDLRKRIESDQKLEAIRKLNDNLYESLPSGKIDAFEIIKLIGSHYAAVAEALSPSIKSDTKRIKP